MDEGGLGAVLKFKKQKKLKKKKALSLYPVSCLCLRVTCPVTPCFHACLCSMSSLGVSLPPGSRKRGRAVEKPGPVLMEGYGQEDCWSLWVSGVRVVPWDLSPRSFRQ